MLQQSSNPIPVKNDLIFRFYLNSLLFAHGSIDAKQSIETESQLLLPQVPWRSDDSHHIEGTLTTLLSQIVEIEKNMNELRKKWNNTPRGTDAPPSKLFQQTSQLFLAEEDKVSNVALALLPNPILSMTHNVDRVKIVWRENKSHFDSQRGKQRSRLRAQGLTLVPDRILMESKLIFPSSSSSSSTSPPRIHLISNTTNAIDHILGLSALDGIDAALVAGICSRTGDQTWEDVAINGSWFTREIILRSHAVHEISNRVAGKGRPHTAYHFSQLEILRHSFASDMLAPWSVDELHRNFSNAYPTLRMILDLYPSPRLQSNEDILISLFFRLYAALLPNRSSLGARILVVPLAEESAMTGHTPLNRTRKERDDLRLACRLSLLTLFLTSFEPFASPSIQEVHLVPSTVASVLPTIQSYIESAQKILRDSRSKLSDITLSKVQPTEFLIQCIQNPSSKGFAITLFEIQRLVRESKPDNIEKWSADVTEVVTKLQSLDLKDVQKGKPKKTRQGEEKKRGGGERKGGGTPPPPVPPPPPPPPPIISEATLLDRFLAEIDYLGLEEWLYDTLELTLLWFYNYARTLSAPRNVRAQAKNRILNQYSLLVNQPQSYWRKLVIRCAAPPIDRAPTRTRELRNKWDTVGVGMFRLREEHRQVMERLASMIYSFGNLEGASSSSSSESGSGMTLEQLFDPSVSASQESSSSSSQSVFPRDLNPLFRTPQTSRDVSAEPATVNANRNSSSIQVDTFGYRPVNDWYGGWTSFLNREFDQLSALACAPLPNQGEIFLSLLQEPIWFPAQEEKRRVESKQSRESMEEDKERKNVEDQRDRERISQRVVPSVVTFERVWTDVLLGWTSFWEKSKYNPPGVTLAALEDKQGKSDKKGSAPEKSAAELLSEAANKQKTETFQFYSEFANMLKFVERLPSDKSYFGEDEEGLLETERLKTAYQHFSGSLDKQ